MKRGVQKYLHISEVLAKCNCREDCNPKSLTEIKVSDLVQVWNGMNLGVPVCVKSMIRSIVSSCFLMRLPSPFCRRYLPKVSTMVTLETESGKLYETKYLRPRGELSGGWRRFAMCEKLVEGDLVIFHLVEASRFKVYIISKGSPTIKISTTLLSLYKRARQCIPDDNGLIVYKRREDRKSAEKSDKETRNVIRKNSEKMEIDFTNVKGFKDFNTIISESLHDHNLSELHLHDYYVLCHAQNDFLHAGLLEGLNSEFFSGVIRKTISETIRIGIALRTCTLSTFLDNFSQWDKMLSYYKALGMNVGVLSVRLDRLRNLAVSSDGAASKNKYIEACEERPRAEHEVKKLEIILAKWREISITLASKVKDLESKAGYEKYMEAYFRLIQAKAEIREIEVMIVEFGKFFEHYDHVIETLKQDVDSHERRFQEEVNEPWFYCSIT